MDTECVQESADAAMKAMNIKTLIAHIVERRIEYLVGTLIAYQMGLLDMAMTAGQQCLV